MKIAVFWLRRDLRIRDNTALSHALKTGLPVLPIFIFDPSILDQLPVDDARVNFIYDTLHTIHQQLSKREGSVLVLRGKPEKVWDKLTQEWEIAEVFLNRDYEPYARRRDKEITTLLKDKGIAVHTFKDQVIFEEDEVVKDDGKPYAVYTPYKRKWLSHYQEQQPLATAATDSGRFLKSDLSFPTKEQLGIAPSSVKVRPIDWDRIARYAERRDYPTFDTTHLGPHLRFGTVSVRELFNTVDPVHETFRSELIWREFFMQILHHFPRSSTQNFKPNYEHIPWRDDKEDFDRWCRGQTGYPLVDAGMRQLNATGYMHNRARMVTASFLCKHLLIDWRWGEAYFAQKLLDFEQSSNVGNWQWVAGTGSDAAPYFRIFNPNEQLKKFDKGMEYVRRWVPEVEELTYQQPIVEHRFARERCLEAYKST